MFRSMAICYPLNTKCVHGYPDATKRTAQPMNQNQHPDQNRNSYPGEVRPMGQHTGQHDRRQADCGDSTDPIKNVSEPFQHVRDASMARRGTAPLQLAGTANIGMRGLDHRGANDSFRENAAQRSLFGLSFSPLVTAPSAAHHGELRLARPLRFRNTPAGG